MLLTLAIVSGFKDNITERVLAYDSPLYVRPTNHYNQTITLIRDDSISDIVEKLIPEAKVSPVFQVPALLKSDEDFATLILRTLPDREKQNFFKESILKGDFRDDSINGIILSTETMKSLKIDTLQKLDVLFYTDSGLKLRRIDIIGIFDTKFKDYDGRIGFITRSTLESLLKFGQTVSTKIEVEPSHFNFKELPRQAKELYKELTIKTYEGKLLDNYEVGNLSTDAASYFAWLSLLDTNVIILIVLMSIIVIFTLISSTTVIIIDRISQIGLLKSIGCSNSTLQKIFILESSRLLFIGIIAASLITIFFVCFQNSFHFLKLDATVYYLSFVPMRLSFMNFLIVDLGTLVLCILCMIMPVKIISRIAPGSVLKFH